MFGNKNTSPSVLAALTAIILSFLFAVGSLFLEASLVSFLMVFLIVFVLTYAVMNYVIQEFIYRKIKLVYKIIFDTKATQRENFYNKELLPQKSIEEVNRDVKKWAVQKRNEIEDLKKNEEFRKEFLLNLSHELKTPIFAIQGYINLLLDGALEDEEVNRRFLENANKSTDRLCQLVADLDEISKLEGGKIPVTPETFVIQDLLRDVFDSLALKGRKKGISFSFKSGCEIPVKVYADKEKIRQVLLNLVDNSIKYGSQYGNTVASIYSIDETRVLIELSDDGIGISEQHLPRIFERFYRTDSARSRQEGGTGLGLAIVKHIIEAHNQTINVRSKPNVGSTFGFTLEKGRR